MGLLTREAEQRLLSWMLINANDSDLPFQQPIMAHLMSANGDRVVEGVEVIGDVYSPCESFYVSTTTTPKVEYVNGTVIEFNAISTTSDVVVAGIELRDSSSPGIRIAYAALDNPITVPSSTEFTIAPGQLKVSLL